jgi:DNA-binding XRE family transcriptional regulator
MVKVICPSCGGAKTGYRISCGDRGCWTSEITCDFCKGEGQVSAEASERWQRGDALRKARVERGLTLSEQAAILGVAPKALNDVEFGRRRLEELVDVAALRCKGIVPVADER